MNKMYAKMAGIGAGIGSAVLLVSKCFATATYTMDTALQTGVTTLFSDYITGAFTIIVAALGVVGGYFVSIKLIHLFVAWIHKLGV